MHDLGQQKSTSVLWHCILTFQRSSETTDLGCPYAYLYEYWQIWRFLGFLEVLRPNMWLFFTFLIFSLHYPMSISPIEPVCPQTILAMSVPLFPSVMLCVTNIPLINCNSTLFCSEVNGKHAGESFRSLQYIGFKIYACKVKKCRFRENLTFDLS